jgi:hypothetical protein
LAYSLPSSLLALTISESHAGGETLTFHYSQIFQKLKLHFYLTAPSVAAAKGYVLHKYFNP